MNIIIDIGNSAVKVARFSSAGFPEDVWTFGVDEMETAILESPVREVTLAIVASSGKQTMRDVLVRNLKHRGVVTIVLKQDGALPFDNKYATGQAGIDRLANVAAAIEHGRLPVIVVDAGSAITVEVVGPDSSFRGGAILPGIRLQAEALHAGTASLPRIDLNYKVAAIGTNTESAIQTGIVNGCAGAVDGLLQVMMNEPGMDAASVIFTGGHGALLAELVQEPNVNVVPNLTLRGLYLLARHQNPDRFS